MAFYETRFPEGISYGSLGGPMHNTGIVQVTAGAEERNGRWTGARLRYNAQNGVKTRAQMAEVIAFARVMKGALHGFRWKDWADFSSDSSHVGLVTTTNADQVIGVGDGVTTQFQLKKVYTRSPAPSVTRLIEKPVQGTVKVAVNAVGKTEGVDYSVSYATGVLTFNVAPTAAHNVTAGFEFDVPSRFGKEADDLFGIRFDGHELRANDVIPIEELLNETPIDDEYNFRDGTIVNPFNVDVTLAANDPLAIAFNPNSSARIINLPNAATLPAGGIWFALQNLHATNTITVKNHAAATVATIAGLAMLTLVIIPDAASANQWVGY